MTETLSIRIDSETKKRLDALSKSSNRSKSFLAAEAWQLGEIRAGIAELDAGESVSHEKVWEWLKSWGRPGEKKAPR